MAEWTVPGYTALRQLGSGGFGDVVLARHDATGTLVAIKYLRANLLADAGFAQMFRSEAAVLALLDDRNVVRLYEYIESPSGAAIVMELVDGVALRQILARHGQTTAEAALVVLQGSLLGLAAAHRRGIVHRDYKPENVLVNGNGVSKLTDFGIAARAGDRPMAAGTLAYAPPEQMSGGEATPAGDVYAATATFYECLTGRPPFTGDTAERVMYQHLFEPVPLEPVPEPLRPLVAAGMAKEPGRRPTDGTTLVTALRAAAAGTYGPDWEDRGRSHLGEAALLLAALWPAGAAPGVQGYAAEHVKLAENGRQYAESGKESAQFHHWWHLRHLHHLRHLAHLRNLQRERRIRPMRAVLSAAAGVALVVAAGLYAANLSATSAAHFQPHVVDTLPLGPSGSSTVPPAAPAVTGSAPAPASTLAPPPASAPPSSKKHHKGGGSNAPAKAPTLKKTTSAPKGPGSKGPGHHGPGHHGPGHHGPGPKGPGPNGPGPCGPGSYGPGSYGPGFHGPGSYGSGAYGSGLCGPGPTGPARAPQITEVYPDSGPAAGGTSVTITGYNLSHAFAVSFGHAGDGTITSDSGTAVTATSPPGSGTVYITVSTRGGTSAITDDDAFTYAGGTYGSNPPEAPTVTGVYPDSGPAAGGTSVTITGYNLSHAFAVSFGHGNGLITSDSATAVTATSPPGHGTVYITVSTPGGTSAITDDDDAFTYLTPIIISTPPAPEAPTVTGVYPDSGPAKGGTSVTITGDDLSDASAVSFGHANGSITSDSATQITATSPPGFGTVYITVSTPGGTSAFTEEGRFTYLTPPPFVPPTTAPPIVRPTIAPPIVPPTTAPPTTAPPTTAPPVIVPKPVLQVPMVTGLRPNSGNEGTTVYIYGTNLSGATSVSFGGAAATIMSVSSNEIIVTAPAGSGTVDVTVTTAAGTSATSSADQFTYTAVIP